MRVHRFLILTIFSILFVVFLPFFCGIAPLKQVIFHFIGLRSQTEITSKKTSFSWTGPQKFFQLEVDHAEFKLKINELTIDTPFWKINQIPSKLKLNNGSVLIKSHSGSLAEVNVDWEGNTLEASANAQSEKGKGKLIIKGIYQSLEQIHLKVVATELPLEPFDWLFNMQGLLRDSLGSYATFSLDANRTKDIGDLLLDLSSPSLRAKVGVDWNKDYITLNRPLYINGIIPSSITKKIHPYPTRFLDPIEITTDSLESKIYKSHSLIEIFKYSQIPSFKINPGRIEIQNLNPFSSLEIWLDSAKIKSQNSLDLWLSCTKASFDQGILKLQRIDGLANDQLHLCYWGDINLLKSEVEGTVGIGKKSLIELFSIPTLPEDYVLQIPVKGNFEKPIFDLKIGAIHLASLLGTQSDLVSKSKWGNIIRGITTSIRQSAEETTPPPCQSKFPWENT
jgi:hypothetical protein